MLKVSYRSLVSPILFSGALLFAGAAYGGKASLFARPAHDDNMPILVVGASYENGSLPIRDDFSSVSGGIAIGFGSYLSLGDALVKSPLLNSFVVNEAQAGDATFKRLSCTGAVCGPAYWDGFEAQFDKTLMRVTIPDPQSSAGVINAKYLVIGMPNDCLHSNAFGVSEYNTSPCTTTDFNGVVDRIRNLAQRALNVGVTPVITLYPRYDELNLPLTQQAFGFVWMIDKTGMDELRELHRARLAAEVPDAILVDAWAGFIHMGDGIHPVPKTSTAAAHRIALAIQRHEAER